MVCKILWKLLWLRFDMIDNIFVEIKCIGRSFHINPEVTLIYIFNKIHNQYTHVYTTLPNTHIQPTQTGKVLFFLQFAELNYFKQNILVMSKHIFYLIKPFIWFSATGKLRSPVWSFSTWGASWKSFKIFFFLFFIFNDLICAAVIWDLKRGLFCRMFSRNR